MAKKIKINKWVPASEEVNFAKLAKLKTGEIKRLRNIELSPDPHRVVISARNANYIVLDDYRANPDRYNNDLEVLKVNIREIICNNNATMKEAYIAYMYHDDGKIHNMSMMHFFFNFVLWRFHFLTDSPVRKKDVFMPYNFTNKEYINFINNRIIKQFRHMFSHNQMSRVLSSMYDDFIQLTEDTGIFLGLTISLYDLINKWDSDPEVYDIMHTKLDPKLQLSEAETYLRHQTDRLRNIFMNDPDDNCLKPMFRCGTGISEKQLREVLVHQGFKPNLAGFTIPMTSDTNLITEGFNNLQSYFVDSAGARKAGILARAISKGGYFAKELCKSASGMRLHPDPDYVCDTKHYYETTIKNLQDLQELHGRWYLTKQNTLRQLIDTDHQLIGKKLKFRTPITCASETGHICKVCYGYMYNQNYGIDIGLNEGLYLSERNYQKAMDGKHILNTTSDVLDFVDEFYRFFDIYQGSSIIIRDDIEDFDYIDIRINALSIEKERDVDDLIFNEYIPSFDIYNKITKERITIKDKNGCAFYLSEELFKLFAEKRKLKAIDDDGFIHIPFSRLEANHSEAIKSKKRFASDEGEDVDLTDEYAVPAFWVRVANDELTKPLKDLTGFIEKGQELKVETYSELVDTLRKLFSKCGINSSSLSVEIITRNLIRDIDNIIQSVDWTEDDPKYQITSVHNSILKSNSVLNSLTFERLMQQFKDPLTYKKNGTSFVDLFFIK